MLWSCALPDQSEAWNVLKILMFWQKWSRCFLHYHCDWLFIVWLLISSTVSVAPKDSDTGVNVYTPVHRSWPGELFGMAITLDIGYEKVTFKVSFFCTCKIMSYHFASGEYMWKWTMTATLDAHSYHSPAPSSRTSSMKQFEKLKTPKKPRHLTYRLTEVYCH